MPKYTLEIGGKTYDIESDRPLSDTELMGYVQRIGAPAPAPAAPPGVIPGAAPGMVAPAAVAAPAPMGQRAIQFIRPTAEALGSAGGAVVGTPLGPLGTVAGAGLGYGIAKTGLDVLEQALGYQRAPSTGGEALTRGVRDVGMGATYETAGRVIAPIAGAALQQFGQTATRALDLKGRQATKLARAAAGREIDAIRAALRNASPDDLPAQATAGIDRKAWQALNALGSSLDDTDKILRRQTEDLMSDLSRMARGGNETEIRNAIEASRNVLNAITSPMRQTELAAANQAAVTLAKLGPKAAQKQASYISALREGMPAPAPAPATPGLAQGAVPGTPRPGAAAISSSTEAAQRAEAAAQQMQRVVPGQIPAISARQAARTQAAASQQWQDTADAFARVATQRRAERDFVQRQIGSLEDYGLRPLDVNSVTNTIESVMTAPGRRVSTIQQQVLGGVRDRLQAAAAINNGVIDARDLYTIRKEGVNEIIDTLMAGRDPKVSKKVAADVLGVVKPAIDDAIEKAGGTAWRDYLKTFEMGAKDLEKRQMAAEAWRLFKDSPNEYVRLVRGNNPTAVESVFGTGNFDIFKEMAREMPKLNKAAAYIERQGRIVSAAKGGQQDLADIINATSWKRRLPNWFSPAITAANMTLKDIEKRLNAATIKTIQEASLSNKSMLELLEGLPPKERTKLVRLINTADTWTRAPAGRAAFVATMPPEEQPPQE